MSRIEPSKSQIEVWEWKEEAWREVQHLPLREALRKRMIDSGKSAKQLKAPHPRRRKDK